MALNHLDVEWAVTRLDAQRPLKRALGTQKEPPCNAVMCGVVCKTTPLSA